MGSFDTRLSNAFKNLSRGQKSLLIRKDFVGEKNVLDKVFSTS